MEEWIIAEVENRASAEDSLITREAPVDGGVDGSPLRKKESRLDRGKMKRMKTYIERFDHLRESETVLAEHFQ